MQALGTERGKHPRGFHRILFDLPYTFWRVHQIAEPGAVAAGVVDLNKSRPEPQLRGPNCFQKRCLRPLLCSLSPTANARHHVMQKRVES